MTPTEIMFALIAASSTFGSAGYFLGRRTSLNGQFATLVTKEGCEAFRFMERERYDSMRATLEEIKQDVKDLRRSYGVSQS
jgi:hypothetical protein